MHLRYLSRLVLCAALLSVFAANASAQGTQAPAKPFEPQVGQAGKDVVWVPTPQALVDKMLDMAKVTPQDFLMDLGSGDGRTVITAAKRGLTRPGHRIQPGHGRSRQAQRRGRGRRPARPRSSRPTSSRPTSRRRRSSRCSCCPSINMKLRPTILNMRPGTRIVSNSFTMEDWQPDQSRNDPATAPAGARPTSGSCPPRSDGTWQLPQGALTLTQTFQMVSGTLGSTPIAGGKLRGDEITFAVGNAVYTGRVQGNTIRGTVAGGSGGAWTATRK